MDAPTRGAHILRFSQGFPSHHIRLKHPSIGGRSQAFFLDTTTLIHHIPNDLRVDILCVSSYTCFLTPRVGS